MFFLGPSKLNVVILLILLLFLLFFFIALFNLLSSQIPLVLMSSLLCESNVSFFFLPALKVFKAIPKKRKDKSSQGHLRC